MNITESTNVDWKQKSYTLELSAEEMVRLWALSYTNEGGDQHISESDTEKGRMFTRFCSNICRAMDLDSDQMEELWSKFINGEYQG